MENDFRKPPLNQASLHQPLTPDIRPDLHINILIASMAMGGAERSVHDILIGLRARNPTGKLFILHDVIPNYPVSDTERLRVFKLGGMDDVVKLRTVAMEVLASPLPIVFTHLIRAVDLRQLWEYGVTTIPVIQNSQPAWQDDPNVYDHPCVPFIVAVSEEVARQLRSTGFAKRVIVLRHELQRGMNPDEFVRDRDRLRQQYGIKKNTLLIGMVGQFKAQKAYTRAVRILHSLRQTHQAKLMILGGWDHDYGAGRLAYTATCKKALELNVLPDMIMPGSVNPVEPYYSTFDVFLNTSIYEGLSVATLEAIQSGCPVVTADAGGQREVLSRNSILVKDPADIEAYVDAIKRLSGINARSVPPPLPKPDLVPLLWCLLGKYGTNPQREFDGPRADTLFVTSNLNPGGAQRSLANLLCALPAEHKSFLFVLGRVFGDSYLQSIEEAGVAVISVRPSASTLERVEILLEWIRKLRVGTVCFWNVDPQIKLLLSKVLEPHPLRLIDVSPGPMLFSELDAASEFQKRISTTSQHYFQRLDYLVVKYGNGEPDNRYGIDHRKVIVIPNGVPLPSNEKNPGTNVSLLPAAADPSLAIVTCCRIVPNKRIEWLIEMMSVLRKEVPGATLTIVGGLDQRHLPYWNEIANKLAADDTDGVYFVGGRSDVFSFLNQFRVFVMISHSQGCPNASLEAMAMGLPVVANADGGTAEQIEEGRNGFLIHSDDPSEMAGHVQYLIQNPGIATSFGEYGRRLVAERFSMQSMVERYMRILVAAEPRAAYAAS